MPEREVLDQIPGGLAAALEAVLMVVDEPVTAAELAAVYERPESEVLAALEALQRDYDGVGFAAARYTGSGLSTDTTTFRPGSQTTPEETVTDAAVAPELMLPGAESRPRGFELRRVGEGWRFYSRSAFAPWVGRFVLDGQTARLTQAALETLAVIAYRQPVSRARISGIRGVNVDSVVRTLNQRGLITELGTDPESGAILYGTTPYFLERLGLTSVEELPKIAPLLPGVEDLDQFDQA
nr:SMC-Scp complex subunit ScpB [Psychromicrobium sp. YIM S02556]